MNFKASICESEMRIRCAHLYTTLVGVDGCWVEGEDRLSR